MEQSQNQGKRRSPIVLIVDDNPAIRHVVSWSLQLSSFECAEAANGREAVQWIERAMLEGRYPTIILLDLAMPGMNGEAFLQWLQNTWPQQYPGPSIIIVTAGYVNEKMFKMFDTYIKQVVTKPFHVRELLEIVRRWAG
jgi:two-component system, chemotaxis family, chemotaxis protein CheY